MRAPKLLRFVHPLWLLALAAGSLVIAAGSLVYFDAEEIPPFVIEKLHPPQVRRVRVAPGRHRGLRLPRDR